MKSFIKELFSAKGLSINLAEGQNKSTKFNRFSYDVSVVLYKSIRVFINVVIFIWACIKVTNNVPTSCIKQERWYALALYSQFSICLLRFPKYLTAELRYQTSSHQELVTEGILRTFLKT